MLCAVLQKLQHRLATAVVSAAGLAAYIGCHAEPREDTEMSTNVHSIEAQRRLMEERNLLRDHAKADAQRLRDEAIDGFIAGADVFVRDAAQRAARAANRLAARLHQHARQRAAAQG
jgi:hypothetical protein